MANSKPPRTAMDAGLERARELVGPRKSALPPARKKAAAKKGDRDKPKAESFGQQLDRFVAWYAKLSDERRLEVDDRLDEVVSEGGATAKEPTQAL